MPMKKTKQSILPLAVFCKEPSKKTYSKHKKLSKRLEKKGTMSVTGKPPAWRVKKEKEEKRKQEEKEAEAKKWEEWLNVKGIVGDGNIDPMRMYLVWGRAPPLESPKGDLYYDGELDSTSSEEDHIDEILLDLEGSGKSDYDAEDRNSKTLG